MQSLVDNKQHYAIILFMFLTSYCPGQVTFQPSEQVNDSSFKQLDIPNNFTCYIAPGISFTSNNTIPLWLRSLQYGAIPQSGLSASLQGGITRLYKAGSEARLLDWGGGLDVYMNYGNKFRITLIEAYIKGRLSIFQLQAGRSRDFMGLVDSTLSSGAFAISGNAPGIPRIDISIPDYWSLPFTNDLIAIKGNLSHGWIGEQPFFNAEDTLSVTTYFHQKSIYGRIGKPHWKFQLFGGFNHNVFWGNYDLIYDNWGLSNWGEFLYVFLGKAYGIDGVPTSKPGNHIGTIDQAMKISLKNITLTGYHQFFYESGALAKLANATDGIFGLSIINRHNTSRNNHNRINNSNNTSTLQWNKIVFEYFRSKSQGGEPDSKPRPDPAEDYYNNWEYMNGWSYKGENIGTTLITSEKYIRDELPNRSFYAPNNRVVAIYLATELQYKQMTFTTRLAWTRNFGNYATAPATKGFDDQIWYYDPPYFGEEFQFYGYVEVTRILRSNLSLNLKIASDLGNVVYNSTGIAFKLIKYWQ